MKRSKTARVFVENRSKTTQTAYFDLSALVYQNFSNHSSLASIQLKNLKLVSPLYKFSSTVK